MLLTRVALAIVSKSSIVSSLVHQSENRMMYYPDQTFFGHNATGCINPKRRSHELHEFHEFSFVEFVRGVDLLIEDAQYTAGEFAEHRGWGHSSIDYVTDVAIKAGVRRAALFHHEPTHADDEIDRMVEHARGRAREANSPVEIFGAAEGYEITF